MQKILRFASYLFFIMGITSLAQFILVIGDVDGVGGRMELGSLIVRLAIMVAFAGAGYMFMWYSGGKGTLFFGWCYAVLSAGVLAVSSAELFLGEEYHFVAFVGYALVALLALGFSVVLSRGHSIHLRFFSLLYIMVALEQGILWFAQVVDWCCIHFWWFVGSVCYFVLTVIAALVLWSLAENGAEAL